VQEEEDDRMNKAKVSSWWLRAVASVLVATVAMGLALAHTQTITLPNGQQATIDWGEGMLVATGQAVPPSNATTLGQKQLLARRGAILDAQRNLLETLAGIQVTSDTTMINLMANDVVRSQVEGMVQGAIVTRQQWDVESEIYTVDMEIPLEQARAVIAIATVAVNPMPDTPTGLVIDVRGLNAVPALYFRIFTESGVEVSAEASAFYLTALPDGMGAPIDEATADPRVADRAFVIRATGLRDNRVDIVISDGDGQLLRVYLGQRNFFRGGNTLVVMN
jgi:hypothetical protein